MAPRMPHAHGGRPRPPSRAFLWLATILLILSIARATVTLRRYTHTNIPTPSATGLWSDDAEAGDDIIQSTVLHPLAFPEVGLPVLAKRGKNGVGSFLPVEASRGDGGCARPGQFCHEHEGIECDSQHRFVGDICKVHDTETRLLDGIGPRALPQAGHYILVMSQSRDVGPARLGQHCNEAKLQHCTIVALCQDGICKANGDIAGMAVTRPLTGSRIFDEGPASVVSRQEDAKDWHIVFNEACYTKTGPFCFSKSECLKHFYVPPHYDPSHGGSVTPVSRMEDDHSGGIGEWCATGGALGHGGRCDAGLHCDHGICRLNKPQHTVPDRDLEISPVLISEICTVGVDEAKTLASMDNSGLVGEAHLCNKAMDPFCKAGLECRKLYGHPVTRACVKPKIQPPPSIEVKQIADGQFLRGRYGSEQNQRYKYPSPGPILHSCKDCHGTNCDCIFKRPGGSRQTGNQQISTSQSISFSMSDNPFCPRTGLKAWVQYLRSNLAHLAQNSTAQDVTASSAGKDQSETLLSQQFHPSATPVSLSSISLTSRDALPSGTAPSSPGSMATIMQLITPGAGKCKTNNPTNATAEAECLGRKGAQFALHAIIGVFCTCLFLIGVLECLKCCRRDRQGRLGWSKRAMVERNNWNRNIDRTFVPWKMGFSSLDGHLSTTSVNGSSVCLARDKVGDEEAVAEGFCPLVVGKSKTLDGATDGWTRWMMIKRGGPIPISYSPEPRIPAAPRIPTLRLPQPALFTARRVSGLPTVNEDSPGFGRADMRKMLWPNEKRATNVQWASKV